VKNGAGVTFSGYPNKTFSYYPNTSENADSPIELAYAITIHKSQGSDFDTVLVVLPKNGRILSRELIYTALTRAKKRLILLVEDNFQWIMEYSKPQNSELAMRNSNLLKFSVRTDKVNDPYPEGLIHITKDHKLLVRSKSEVIIANELINAGLEFEYEKLLEENGSHRIPDFTFVDAAGETIIWEHLGMLSNPAYKESWERKLKFYHSIGFKEGENLFTTEDHENGAIDTTEVMAVIEKIKNLLI
ncbi:MAG: ATP-binding domain-containing protein, partial [Bacteroidales bacterium]|nr:ATP-binding domain-containing protein [Bacteroidales bacterium]